MRQRRHRITQLRRRLVVPVNSGYVVNAQAPTATLYATTSLQNYPAYTSPTSQDPFTGALFVAGLLSSSREVVNSGSYGHYASYPAITNIRLPPILLAQQILEQ